MRKSTSNKGDSKDKFDLNISNSFLLNEFTTIDDFLNTVDHRMNIKIA